MQTSSAHFFERFLTSQFSRFASASARYTRTLPVSAQQDIFNAALLAAWEKREEFDDRQGQGSMEGRLLAWFCGLVRNERRRFYRSELPRGSVVETALDALISGRDTSADAHNQNTMTTLAELIATLSPEKQSAAQALAEGASVREVAAQTGLNRGIVKDLKKRLRFKLKTDADSGYVVGAPTARTPAIHDPETTEMATIDHAIAQLDFPPSPGAHDCPSCFLCTWWDYLPPKRIRVRMRIQDDEVRAAAEATHARKIEISRALRGIKDSSADNLAPTEPETMQEINAAGEVEEIAA